jgi:5-aminolevulinate synthase
MRLRVLLHAENGLHAQPINFPTVPRGTDRLRFTPGPQHGADMMAELVGALVEIWGREDVRLAA